MGPTRERDAVRRPSAAGAPYRTPTGRCRTATVTGVVLAALLAPVVVGTAPPARAEECPQEVTGEELPASGAHPLIGQLGLPQAWDLATGVGATVAVVDSGVDASHPDLADAVTTGSVHRVDTRDGSHERDTEAPVLDCAGSGTALAGLVAARRSAGDRMAGVAPDATVYPVRYTDGIDDPTAAMLAAMVDDAVAAGADVLLLPLAVPMDWSVVREAVGAAVDEDVVVVAAAGDGGADGAPSGAEQPMYPAAYDGVLGVGAVGADGMPLDSSVAGGWVDLAAYGEELVVVAPGGSGYRAAGGTAFAAAQVAGAAALVRSRFPDLPAEVVTERLTRSAAPVGGVRDDRTGWGIVDPYAALTQRGEEADPPPPVAGGGGVAVRPLPEETPRYDDRTVTAFVASGVLLLAVALGLTATPAFRRAVARRWRTGAAPGTGEGAAPEPPTDPADGRLAWLEGTTTRRR